MCDYTIKNGNKCSKPRLSGKGTIENSKGDMIAHLCTQHKALYDNALLDMSRVVWTPKVKVATKGVVCGKCKGTHASVNDVRACYGLPADKTVVLDKRQFKHGKEGVEKRIERFIAGDGQWFDNKKAQVQFTDALKAKNISFTTRTAKNKNGFWVYPVDELQMKLGDGY